MYKFFLLAFLITTSCSFKGVFGNQLLIIVPDDYSGPVSLVYDEVNGVAPVIKNNGTVSCEVDSRGLFISNSPIFFDYIHANSFSIHRKNGTRERVSSYGVRDIKGARYLPRVNLSLGSKKLGDNSSLWPEEHFRAMGVTSLYSDWRYEKFIDEGDLDGPLIGRVRRKGCPNLMFNKETLSRGVLVIIDDEEKEAYTPASYPPGVSIKPGNVFWENLGPIDLLNESWPVAPVWPTSPWKQLRAFKTATIGSEKRVFIYVVCSDPKESWIEPELKGKSIAEILESKGLSFAEPIVETDWPLFDVEKFSIVNEDVDEIKTRNPLPVYPLKKPSAIYPKLIVPVDYNGIVYLVNGDEYDPPKKEMDSLVFVFNPDGLCFSDMPPELHYNSDAGWPLAFDTSGKQKYVGAVDSYAGFGESGPTSFFVSDSPTDSASFITDDFLSTPILEQLDNVMERRKK